MAELSEQMDAEEFNEWLAFDQLSPIGGERADCLHAMQAALTANVWSKRKFTAKQFLPRWGRENRGRSFAELQAYFLTMKQDAERRQRRG